MRDINRLDNFYNELKKIHKKVPDWRFGQFYSNFFCLLMDTKGIDLFFPEEDEMLKYLKEFISEVT